MEFGISTACFYPLETELAVKRLVDLKVNTIEIFFNSYSELKPKFVNSIKDITSENNVEIVSVHPFNSVFEPFMFFSTYERRYEDILDVYKEYFDVMNILGAQIFVFHGDKKDSGINSELYFERFSHLVKIGKSMGITVAQENVSRCKSRSNEFLKKMKNEISDVKFVFDIKQAIRSDNDPFETLEIMGENLIHIHASDNDKSHSCLEIGKGSFDFKRLFKELKRLNYDKKIILELYREDYNEYADLFNSVEKLKLFAEN
jgi:sugar phosphate isomerase/epimerase